MYHIPPLFDPLRQNLTMQLRLAIDLGSSGLVFWRAVYRWAPPCPATYFNYRKYEKRQSLCSPHPSWCFLLTFLERRHCQIWNILICLACQSLATQSCIQFNLISMGANTDYKRHGFEILVGQDSSFLLWNNSSVCLRRNGVRNSLFKSCKTGSLRLPSAEGRWRKLGWQTVAQLGDSGSGQEAFL